jgi:murein DD-endopeptidase MepM/ murein hydrolase activator NlpD
MNLKWHKKKLTVMIIPEANQSVVRLRIPNMYAYAALFSLLMVLLISCTVYFLHINNLRVTSELKSQLSGANQQLSETMAAKEQAIELLQNDVIQLSEQTQLMKTQVEEMKKLEKDLKEIAQIDLSESSSDAPSLANAASADSTPVLSHGVGGAMIAVSEEDILELGQETKSTLTELSKQVELLRTSLTETKQKVEEKQHLLSLTPTIWPTTSKVVSSPFGYRKDPFTKVPSFHSGLDIAAKEDEPVFAAAEGTVVSVGSDKSHGNNIVIEHSKGLRTWYMHLNKNLVQQGQTVKKGETIGLLGSTGRSTGPHLHYEVIKNGVSIDPRPFLQTTRKDES